MWLGAGTKPGDSHMEPLGPLLVVALSHCKGGERHADKGPGNGAGKPATDVPSQGNHANPVELRRGKVAHSWEEIYLQPTLGSLSLLLAVPWSTGCPRGFSPPQVAARHCYMKFSELAKSC